MEIKDIIKEARTKSGLTQEQAAEKILVTRQTISNWENGKSLPDVLSIIKMSDLYQISLDELLKGDKKMVEKIEKEETLRKSERKELARAAIVIIIGCIFIILSGFGIGVDDKQSNYMMLVNTLSDIVIILTGCSILATLYFDRAFETKYNKYSFIVNTILTIALLVIGVLCIGSVFDGSLGRYKIFVALIGLFCTGFSIYSFVKSIKDSKQYIGKDEKQ